MLTANAMPLENTVNFVDNHAFYLTSELLKHVIIIRYNDVESSELMTVCLLHKSSTNLKCNTLGGVFAKTQH